MAGIKETLEVVEAMGVFGTSCIEHLRDGFQPLDVISITKASFEPIKDAVIDAGDIGEEISDLSCEEAKEIAGAVVNVAYDILAALNVSEENMPEITVT